MERKSRRFVPLLLHVLILISLPIALGVATADYFGLVSRYPQLQLEPAASTSLVVEKLKITDVEGREKTVFEKGETVQVEVLLRASAEVARKLELRLECTVYGPQGEAVQMQSQRTWMASGQISRIIFGFGFPSNAVPGQYMLEVEFLEEDTGEHLSPTKRWLFTAQASE